MFFQKWRSIKREMAHIADRLDDINRNLDRIANAKEREQARPAGVSKAKHRRQEP